MTEKVYLDTSALVKRYLEEEGSEKVDSLFNESYDKSVVLVISQWNIGEAAVVFDKYQNRKVIRDARQPFQSLYNEASLLSWARTVGGSACTWRNHCRKYPIDSCVPCLFGRCDSG